MDNNYTTRTVKVQLKLSAEEKESVIATMHKCKVLFQEVIQLCNTLRTANYYTICTPEGYASLRRSFPSIPSMMIQQIVKEGCACVKVWNRKHKDRQWQCAAARTRLSYPINKRTLTIRGSLCTFSSVNARIRTIIEIPDWFRARYGINANDVQAGTVKYIDGVIWLNLLYKVTCVKTTGTSYIGVDRGLYNLVALSDGTIISSKKAVAIKRRYQHLRSKLQQKGTRSAKRHLKSMSGREKRFMSDFNHVVSKQMASRSDVGTYILEDLRGIRNRRKGKKLNSWLSNWPYFEFQYQLEYKCALNGISVEYVDPRYTSQKCSCCGVTDKKSRNRSRYHCLSCGHTDHADINAAKNIRDNYVRSKAEQGASTVQS